MNNYLSIYLLTRLDSIHSLFVGLTIAAISALIAGIIFGPLAVDAVDYDSRKTVKESIGKWIKRLPYIAIFSAFIAAFTPDKDEVIMIVAGGKAMDYVQSDSSLNKLPYQTTAIISEYLDKQIKELKEDEKK